MTPCTYGCERASTEQPPSSPDPDHALPPFPSPVREVRAELAREESRRCANPECRWHVWDPEGATCHWCRRERAL